LPPDLVIESSRFYAKQRLHLKRQRLAKSFVLPLGEGSESAAYGMSRRDSIHELAIPNHKDSCDQNPGNALRVLSGFVEGGTIDHAARVNDGDVRVGSDLQKAFRL
jgi:hypothetical protein